MTHLKVLNKTLFPALIVLLAMVGLSSMVSNITASHPTSIVLKRNQVLYVGVDNPIQIVIDGIDPDRLLPRITGGALRPDTIPGHYIARVIEGSKATINVFVKENGADVKCGSFDYRIKKIPDPVTYIAHVRHEGVILKENLQMITGVFTRMENFDFDCGFMPQSFSMSVIEDGEWKEYKAIGPELTAEMKVALTKAEEEDKIIFHNVMTKGKGPLEDVRKVNNVVITVK